MNYRLNKNGDYWQVAYEDSSGARRRISIGKGTPAEAKRKMRQIEKEHRAIPAARDIESGWSLSGWLDRFSEIRSREVSELTAQTYESTTRYLCEYFTPSKKMTAITRSDMTDWLMWLSDKPEINYNTAAKHAKHAKVIFKRATRENVIAVSPAEFLNASPLKKDAYDRREVTAEEVERVLEHAGWATPVIMLCYYAGLRKTEALSLRWADTIECITVRTRSGIETTKQRTRFVPIEPELQDWLDSQVDTSPDSLVADLNGNSHESVLGKIKSACEAAGVQPFNLNNLRSARATSWFGKYLDHEYEAFMGHKKSVAIGYYCTIGTKTYKSSHATSQPRGDL